MNEKSNITFGIPVYNEEKRLPMVIKNFSGYGKIIFLDGGSTDNTVSIAHSFDIEIYDRPKSDVPYVETRENFELLKSKLTTDWIYWGYADNLVPKKTLEKMLEVTRRNDIKIVYAPLYTYLWGLTKKPSHKSYIPILVHKDYINFSKPRIHSMGDFTGKTTDKLFLPNNSEYAVQHFSVYNSHKFILGHLKYAETEAEEKYKSSRKFSLFRLFISMLYYMWIYGKFAIRNGKLGIIIILHYASFRLMAFTRLYELENNINLTSIESSYLSKQNEFLKQFE